MFINKTIFITYNTHGNNNSRDFPTFRTWSNPNDLHGLFSLSESLYEILDLRPFEIILKYISLSFNFLKHFYNFPKASFLIHLLVSGKNVN